MACYGEANIWVRQRWGGLYGWLVLVLVLGTVFTEEREETEREKGWLRTD